MIPKSSDYYTLILMFLSDCRPHSSKEIRKSCDSIIIDKKFLPSYAYSNQSKITYNIIDWARIKLEQAGLIISIGKSIYNITNDGKKAIDSEETINDEYLKKFEEYNNFLSGM